GGFGRAAQALGLIGAGLLAVRGRHRGVAAAGGTAVLAASLCERFSVFQAGSISARDPRHVGSTSRRASAR
ncbi:MAG TPA: hypothetical protein VH134_17890, partial [Candidatus Dormibacteraeota bacterium]|nr:hypothetical protein [Candidatus Dormibacteraeota bacterium]